MQTLDIPCGECAAKKAVFAKAGFTIFGCEAHATQPGLCTLRYGRSQKPAKAPARAAAGAARRGATPAAKAAPVDAPANLTATQAQTAKAIVNLFETSRVLGNYGAVTVLQGDTGRLTYGRSQTSLASGNLFKLLARYCDNAGARFAQRFTALLPAFEAQAESLDHDRQVHNLLRAAADDRVMRDTQDVFFDEAYWQPALRQAQRLGIRSPLGVTVVYDSLVQGSLGLVRDATNAAVGALAQVGEQRWVAAFVQQRRDWLANHSNKLLHKTVYRMDAFQRLIENDNWGLALPLVVRGQEISSAVLGAPPEGCYDGPQPGTRVLGLADPLPRGLDVRLLQLGLSDRGMNIVADGVFGRASSDRIREFQIAQGLPATGAADAALFGMLLA